MVVVSIICNQCRLQVRIKQKPYLYYQKPQHYEIYLGTVCPIMGGMLDFFEFFYPLSSCEIRVEEHLWGTLIKSFITYVLVNLNTYDWLPPDTLLYSKKVCIHLCAKGEKE